MSEAVAKGAAPQEKNSSFYLGFLFLPAKKREALSAVYAYCRHVDDVVDDGSRSVESARNELGFWREELDRLYEGRPTHPAAERLLPHIRAWSLPKGPFLEMLRGCEMDLVRSRYETISELEAYMACVASAVGLLSVEIFGYRTTPAERIKEFATLFGYAFQLTNIIRDVGVDLGKDRIYLPAADMREAGYTPEALSRRERGDAFMALMEREYGRAKDYYARARALLDPADRPAMLPAEVMAHIYEGLLEQIRGGGFQVLHAAPRQGAWRKAGLAMRAWLYCRGFSSPR